MSRTSEFTSGPVEIVHAVSSNSDRKMGTAERARGTKRTRDRESARGHRHAHAHPQVVVVGEAGFVVVEVDAVIAARDHPRVTRQAQETTRIDLPTGSVTLPFTDIAGSTRLSHTPTDPLPQLTDRRHARLRAAITDGLAPDLA